VYTTLLPDSQFPPPSPSSRVLSKLDGLSARLTTYACIAFVIQLVIGDLVLLDVSPHLVIGPIRKWIHFYYTSVGLIKLNFLDIGPCDALLSS